MTNCDFSVRSARDEMRHIIGSREPDVIIGSDQDQNGGCRRNDKDHRNSFVSCTKHKRRAVATLCMSRDQK